MPPTVVTALCPSPPPGTSPDARFARSPSRSPTSSTSLATSRFLPEIKGSFYPALAHGFHRLLQGTSEAFCEAIQRKVERRFFQFEADSSPRSPRHVDLGHVLEKPLEIGRTRLIYDQGLPARSELDGLLLMMSHDSSEVEVLYRGTKAASLSGEAFLNAEHALGLASFPVFSIKLRAETLRAMLFIPRSHLEWVCAQPHFQQDAKLLRERVRLQAEGFVRSAFTRSGVPIRLFANTDRDLRTTVLKLASFRWCRSGTTICDEGAAASSCCWLVQGEASVLKGNWDLATVSSKPSLAASASWWGLLEIHALCPVNLASLRAKSDCLVAEFSAGALSTLMGMEPALAPLFQQMVARHLALLPPRPVEVPPAIRQSCSAGLVAAIARGVSHRICVPGEILVHEDERVPGMLAVAIGRVSASRKAETRALADLEPGGARAFHGKLAALGLPVVATKTLVCSTICQIWELSCDGLRSAVATGQDELSAGKPSSGEDAAGVQLQRLADVFAGERHVALGLLRDLVPAGSGRLGESFLQELMSRTSERFFTPGQVIVRQGDTPEEVLFLVQGRTQIVVDGADFGRLAPPALLCQQAVQRLAANSTMRADSVSVFLALPATHLQTSDTLRDKYPEDLRRFCELLSTLQEDEERHLATAVVEQEGSHQAKDALPGAFSFSSAALAPCSSALLQALSLTFEHKFVADGQLIAVGSREEELFPIVSLCKGAARLIIGGAAAGEVGPEDDLGHSMLLGVAQGAAASLVAKGNVHVLEIPLCRVRSTVQAHPEDELILMKRIANHVRVLRLCRKVRSSDAACRRVSEPWRSLQQQQQHRRHSRLGGSIAEMRRGTGNSGAGAASSLRGSVITRFRRPSVRHRSTSSSISGSQAVASTLGPPNRPLQCGAQRGLGAPLAAGAQSSFAAEESEDAPAAESADPEDGYGVSLRLHRWRRRDAAGSSSAQSARSTNDATAAGAGPSLPGPGPALSSRAAPGQAGSRSPLPRLPLSARAAARQQKHSPSSLKDVPLISRWRKNTRSCSPLPPLDVRQQQAKSIYERPVWSEVFGKPIAAAPASAAS